MTTRLRYATAMVPISLTLLSFFPIVSHSDPMSGGVTEGRLYTLGLQGVGFALIVAISLHAKSWPPRLTPSFAILGAFSLLALASAFWSPSMDLTSAKSVQLLLITATGTFIGAHLRGFESRDSGTLIGLACLTVVATLIIANTVLWGTALTFVGGGRLRLVLANAHPLTTGTLAALGVLALLNARLPRWPRMAALVALSIVLILTNARTAITIVASYLALRGLVRMPISIRAYVLLVITGVSVSALLLFGPQLEAAVSNEMAHGDVATLNGRVPLWEFALTRFAERPLVGHGYYSSRFLFLARFPWAGQAHSSFVEVLVTTGLLGFVLLALFILYVARLCHRSKDPLLVAISLFAVVDSTMNPGIFDPSMVQFVLLVAITTREFRDGQERVRVRAVRHAA